MKKRIYVYHHNDHDGIVAAGILYNYLIENNLGKYENFIFKMIDYDMELNFDHIDFNTDQVYFLDYSFSNKVNLERFINLLKRKKDFKDVYWFDHHVTSIDISSKLNEVIPGLRFTDVCASVLVYLYFYEGYTQRIYKQKNELKNVSEIFHNNTWAPMQLKLIDDYDCWKHIYPSTNSFHYGLTISDPRDERIKDLISGTGLIGMQKTIDTGIEIQKYLSFENREYHINMYGFEYTLPEIIGGYKCFCLNRKGNSLMFGDKIKEYDAVIPFYYINGKWKYSIFTEKDNVNCEAIAKYYGGGGHLKAAGWVLDDLIFTE